MTTVVRFHELGGPEVLRLERHSVGEPGSGEVRLRVDAIGLNHSEANFRRGRYLDKPRALPSGLGYEAAGEIETTGPGVTGLEPGDPVSVLPTFLQSDYHVYGERAIVPASAVVRRPEDLSAVAGAAVWMAYTTAYGALVDIARVRPGDHVVITAASSSVGLATMRVAAALGAIPIATTNSRAKRPPLLDAGAAEVIVIGEDDLVDRVLRITSGRGAEWVFDAVAGSGVHDLARATAQDGTLFVHGTLSGEPTPLPGLDRMRPVFTRPYTLFEITRDPDRLGRAKHFVTAGLRSGALQPTVDRTFDLEDIVEAHRYLEAGAQIGKIVVTVRHRDTPA
jgi:NADPH:quinone reductase-like Zn-dependent oxidoreductase